MEEAKYSIYIPLPKSSQYDTATSLTIRADHSEELDNTVTALFGEGVFDRIKGLALQSLLSLPTGTGAAPAPQGGAPAAVTAPTAAPAPARGGGTGSASQESQGPCPACGQGQLVKKFKRGSGDFMGVGCNRYPDCQHMAYWAN